LFSGHLGSYDFEIKNATDQLTDHYYPWKDKERTLESFIKLAPIEAFLDDGTQVYLGTVYFEYLKKTRNIVKDGKSLTVKMDQEVIDTKWSKFWLSSIGFLIVQDGRNKEKVFEILGSAFGQPPNKIKALGFDIDRMALDYSRKWIGAFKDREGNVHSGTLYGEDIDDDPEFGDPFKHTLKKNQLGITTEHFEGIETKVRVTRKGFLQIFKSLDENPEQVIELIRDEFSDYLLEPSK